MTDGLSLKKHKLNTNKMHDFIISGLIIAIVIVQVMVALSTTKKIALFKTIIPNSQNFETVKVYIPESQIKDVTVDYILDNLDKYSSIYNSDTMIEATITEEETVAIDSIHNTEPEILLMKPIEADGLIWISKENEEKKIAVKLLEKYEALGWAKIE